MNLVLSLKRWNTAARGCAVAAISSLLIALPASGAVVINIDQVGSTVVASTVAGGSLEIDAANISFPGVPSNVLAGINDQFTTINIGGGSYDDYIFDEPFTEIPPVIVSAFRELGSDSSSGTTFGFVTSGRLSLPSGYVSGDLLGASTSTFFASFTTLGLTAGSSTVLTIPTLSTGVPNTITVNVNAPPSAVPEPGATLPLLGLGFALLLTRKRRAYLKG